MKILNLKKKTEQSTAENQNNGEVTESRQKVKMPALEINKKSLIRFALILIPAIIILLAAIGLTNMVKKSSWYKVTAPAEQYYAGEVYSIPEGSVLIPDDNGITLKSNGVQMELSTLPIFEPSDKKMILATDMIYYAPRDGIRVCVPQFTEILYNEYGICSAQRGSQSTTMKQGFFYDGDNLYVFTEPCTLTFNGYVFNLGPMSYVEADGANNIIVYNSSDGETFMETPSTKVTVTVDGAYTVSLLGDSMETSDGVKSLLIADPSILPSLF